MPKKGRKTKNDFKQNSERKKGWWFAKFKMRWPEDGNPLKYVDLLIAYELVRPILEEQEHDIELWRVHRRFVNDDTGHQFSFIFYTLPTTAASIFNDFRRKSIISGLRRNNILKSVRYDRTDKIRKPNIEDTCDLNWTDMIQKWWPQYAMGVSRLWLGLVSDVTDASKKGHGYYKIKEKIELFKNVEYDINILWQNQCSHPLLHHLNAIFGYIPIGYIPRQQQHYTIF